MHIPASVLFVGLFIWLVVMPWRAERRRLRNLRRGMQMLYPHWTPHEVDCYLRVTWARQPQKRKHHPQSLAPPPPSRHLTPEQVALVVVLAQTLPHPHHHSN
jgi:hypothetical protein